MVFLCLGRCVCRYDGVFWGLPEKGVLWWRNLVAGYLLEGGLMAVVVVRGGGVFGGGSLERRV